MPTVERSPCPACRENSKDRAGDNLVHYEDGSRHCFSCSYHEHPEGDHAPAEPKPPEDWTAINGQVRSLVHRKISQEVCRHFNYRVAKVRGEYCEVANYYTKDQLQAQHIRRKGKRFLWRGDTKGLTLYGQHLWRAGGKRLIITEGEIDALSIAQAQAPSRWPVVSLPNGVGGAERAVKDNYEFIASFDEVVLAFDNDEPGKAGAEACAAILPPGKVRIASFARKDASEHLMHNELKQMLVAIYEARRYQPDGILHVSDIQHEQETDPKIWAYPWPKMTRALFGQRSGEITMYTSGTGSGKSTLIRELMLHHLAEGRKVGAIMLEESVHETLDELIGLRLNKPVRQIKALRTLNEAVHDLDFDIPDDLTEEEYLEARRELSDMPLYLYNHVGVSNYNSITSRLEYMASVLECDVVFLDHVTAVVAGMEYKGSEREAIDSLLKSLRGLVAQTGVHLGLVSQLRRPEGKAIEEGGQISLALLRGSGSLASVPNNVLAIERDQQAELPEDRRKMTVRALKNRFSGETGTVTTLTFNPDTRRLEEPGTIPDSEPETAFEPQAAEAAI